MDWYVLSGLFLEDNNPITLCSHLVLKLFLLFNETWKHLSMAFESCLILNMFECCFAFGAQPFTILQVSLKNSADGINRKQINILRKSLLP